MESQNSTNNTEQKRGGRWFSPYNISARKYSYVLTAFIIAGVLGGYAYYALIGCRTGSCAITSNPYMSMAWGGMLGYLLPDFFVKKRK